MRIRVVLVFLLSISLFPIWLYSQTVVKLSGDIIGTTNCVDYANNNQHTTTVNTAANLFDGDFQTFFATFERSGTWAGLDLGSKHVITKVAYCPRADWNSRVVLGVFEGANSPDFGDAVPLFVISSAPVYNQMTGQDIDCSRGFRYVRYVGPNNVRCNIAELAFYGYASEGSDAKLVQVTNLPTISIHTVDAEDVIEKEKYLKGIVSVISENGTKIYTDSLEIKGRGNASWNFPKKPYRLKLYNKTNLLDLPAKEKNWTLINNYGDKTLMRNLLAFDLSERLEMPYTPAGIPVDVILNGEYKGTYQLCDQIEVASKRVEVEKMQETDVTLPALSGGYLIEVDAYAYQEISWFESARNRIPVTIKYPKDDEIVSAQSNYIKSHFDMLEEAVFADNYTDQINGYRKYLHLHTFIRHFLVGEISGNTDTYWSVYMYKKRNNDLLYVGPVWDFDIAFDNDNRTYPINNNTNWIYASNGSAANGMRAFVNRIFSDPAFYNELKSVYAYYRDNGTLTKQSLTAVVDNYASELERSQQLNFIRWDILNQKVHQNPQALGNYEAEVNVVRNYIRNRLDWMDNKLSYGTNSLEDPSLMNDIKVWAGTGTLHLTGVLQTMQVNIVDIAGRTLFSGEIGSDYSFPLKKGIYIVRISNQSAETVTVKCIVR